VIADFVASWDLFHDAYLAGWLIAVLLALVGVVVVARDQIFVGAAVAQASALGVALGMWAGEQVSASTIDPQHIHGPLSLTAVAMAIAAAWLTTGGGAGRTSVEAVTGWVFLASSSFAILLLAHSPHGLEEIHHLLSSSIIGATPIDVLTFSALVVATIAFVAWKRDPLTLFVTDPAMAAAVGMRVRSWSGLLSAWLGLAVGLSMRASGLLFTFGCLVLPALTAARLCRETRWLFVVAPLLALATAAIGFVLANYHDHPPAQMTVAVQSALLFAVWLWRWGE